MQRISSPGIICSLQRARSPSMRKDTAYTVPCMRAPAFCPTICAEAARRPPQWRQLQTHRLQLPAIQAMNPSIRSPLQRARLWPHPRYSRKSHTPGMKTMICSSSLRETPCLTKSACSRTEKNPTSPSGSAKTPICQPGIPKSRRPSPSTMTQTRPASSTLRIFSVTKKSPPWRPGWRSFESSWEKTSSFLQTPQPTGSPALSMRRISTISTATASGMTARASAS